MSYCILHHNIIIAGILFMSAVLDYLSMQNKNARDGCERSLYVARNEIV